MKKIDAQLMRVMYLSEAFGKSGNLTSDIMEICRKMKVTINVLDSSTGHTLTGDPGNNYLFGGKHTSYTVTVEMISTQERLTKVKQRILEVVSIKNDNIIFYRIPVEGYILNEIMEFPPPLTDY